jgi:hypothetical protein
MPRFGFNVMMLERVDAERLASILREALEERPARVEQHKKVVEVSTHSVDNMLFALDNTARLLPRGVRCTVELFIENPPLIPWSTLRTTPQRAPKHKSI